MNTGCHNERRVQEFEAENGTYTGMGVVERSRQPEDEQQDHVGQGIHVLADQDHTLLKQDATKDLVHLLLAEGLEQLVGPPPYRNAPPGPPSSS